MLANVIASILLTAVGGATCTLPGPEAGTALDYDTMKGFILEDADDPRLEQFAPIILVEHYEETYNRVGEPSARFDKKEHEEIYVDPAHPVYYTDVMPWEGDHGKYTNLVYRVHFEMSKGNDNSTDGGKGYNTGMLVIVTLDETDHPRYVNVVQTCGCFHALLPTSYLPKTDFPDTWDPEAFYVYGETLPGMLAYPKEVDPNVRPVVFLRDGSHRMADIDVATITSVRDQYELIPATAKPLDALEHLKLGDGETSFFFEEGKNKGLVKGAFKRKESFLLGLVVGDTHVGQDRKFGSEEEVPRGFYTTIKPGEKEESEMWDYKGFLEHNGWKP
jgi:hypothetical protein